MIASIRQALTLLQKGRKWILGTVIITASLSSLVEALTAGLVFQLIRLIDNPAAFLTRLQSWSMLSFLQTWSPSSLMRIFTLLVMGLYALRSLLFLLEVYLQSRLVNQEAENLSSRLITGYSQAPYVFHLQHHSAEILHKVFQDIRNGFVVTCLGIAGMASEIFMICALVGVLIFISPALTLGMASVLALLLLILIGPLQKWVQYWGRYGRDVSEESYRHLQQLLHGLKEIKVSGREPYFLEKFTHHEHQFHRLRNYLETATQIPRSLIEILISVVAAVAILYMLAKKWAPEHIIAILGIYAYCVFRIMPSLNRLSNYISQIRYYQSSITSIVNTFSALRPFEKSNTVSTHYTSRAALSFQHAIKLQDISYCYPTKKDVPALKNITFTLAKGDCIGIVGTTGAGKSTLVDVLLGLLEPQQGQVLADGQDICQNLRGWQNKIGYVPQFPYLLDDTLAANIAFGSTTHDQTRLWTVVRMAQLESLIKRLPQGIQTKVGEQGIRLSGGERQRIAIARALYGDPEILIFDEATASLDNETERQVMDTILGIRREKTVIIIAHRLATVESCDRLVLLKEGTVVAIDAYQDLLSYQEDFQKLARAATP